MFCKQLIFFFFVIVREEARNMWQSQEELWKNEHAIRKTSMENIFIIIKNQVSNKRVRYYKINFTKIGHSLKSYLSYFFSIFYYQIVLVTEYPKKKKNYPTRHIIYYLRHICTKYLCTLSI